MVRIEVCKNCGHEIVLIPTEEGKSFWFHKNEFFLNTDYNKNNYKKVMGKSWSEVKRYCNEQINFTLVTEIKGKEIKHSVLCGCLKAEPKGGSQ